MLTEITIASNFITIQIFRNLTADGTQPLPPGINVERLADFGIGLFYSMYHTFRMNWNIRNPLRGQDERLIRLRIALNVTRHVCIEHALGVSGLTYRDLRLDDLNVDLVINPGIVYVIDQGEHPGRVTTIYDHNIQQLGDWMNQYQRNV